MIFPPFIFLHFCGEKPLRRNFWSIFSFHFRLFMNIKALFVFGMPRALPRLDHFLNARRKHPPQNSQDSFWWMPPWNPIFFGWGLIVFLLIGVRFYFTTWVLVAIQGNGLNEMGATILAEGICQNTTLLKLDISGVCFWFIFTPRNFRITNCFINDLGSYPADSRILRF